MEGCKTTYSTDENQLNIPRKFSNLSEPSLPRDVKLLYISYVNSYCILLFSITSSLYIYYITVSKVPLARYHVKNTLRHGKLKDFLK